MEMVMLKRRWGLPVLAALLVALAQPLVAAAHPLGNFTVNHYSRLEPYANLVRVRYVLDMAEIPTYQALSDIDQDHNGQVSQAENERYRALLVEQLRQNLTLRLNGATLPLTAVAADMTFPPGQGNLNTLRLTIWFEAALPAATRLGSAANLSYQDNNDVQHVGWTEISVRPGPGVQLGASNIITADQSNELRAYPVAMLSSPLTERAAQLAFTAGLQAADAPALQGDTESASVQAADPFARLVGVADLRPEVILFALLAATVYGALHAFTPGHGKTMVGAYLVGTRGTPRHALLLGLTVTTTHTLGVYVLGLVTLFLARYIVPERLYPILGAASGIFVVLIGVGLFINRLRAARQMSAEAPGSAALMHTHAAGQDPLAAHSHGGAPHSHAPMLEAGTGVSIRSLLTLGISGGLVPCPSALLVMLGALALNRAAFGLVLIVAFSLGLAVVLTGTGLALVYAGKLFDRLSINARWIQLISAGSALLMALIGVVAIWQAVVQITL
jgi:ABC-type nickel/cobalt efflux system permease component RcnA